MEARTFRIYVGEHGRIDFGSRHLLFAGKIPDERYSETMGAKLPIV
jgi:hypothetical protein